MAEQNKPKIDLKARLGRKTVEGGGGPSIPPPMATGSSIPAPPFASKPPPSQEPEQPKPAAPQAIKIEMSEEVVQAQKKGRSKIILIAVGTALVGVVLGWALGGGMERRTRQNLALQGADLLSDEVDEANIQAEKLAEILENAKRSLSDGEYPDEQIKALGDVTIPFDGTYLVGKGIGLMSPDINRMLVDYAGGAQQANEQKDRLQRVMMGAREPIEELLAQKDKPKFNWAVFVTGGPHGPMAAMQPFPEPFLVTSKEKVENEDGDMVKYDWPEEFEIPDGDDKVTLERYEGGDPTRGGDPELIPVDPSTQSLVCSSDTMNLLRKEIVGLERLLKGDKSDPTNEKAGLLDTGKRLIDELKGIGQ